MENYGEAPKTKPFTMKCALHSGTVPPYGAPESADVVGTPTPGEKTYTNDEHEKILRQAWKKVPPREKYTPEKVRTCYPEPGEVFRRD